MATEIHGGGPRQQSPVAVTVMITPAGTSSPVQFPSGSFLAGPLSVLFLAVATVDLQSCFPVLLTL